MKKIKFSALCMVVLTLGMTACNSDKIDPDWNFEQEYCLQDKNTSSSVVAMANFWPYNKPTSNGQGYDRVQLNNNATITANGVDMTYRASITMIEPEFNYYTPVTGDEVTFVFTTAKGVKITNTASIADIRMMYPVNGDYSKMKNGTTYKISYLPNHDGNNEGNDDGGGDGPGGGDNPGDILMQGPNVKMEVVLSSTTTSKNYTFSVADGVLSYTLAGVEPGTYLVFYRAMRVKNVQEQDNGHGGKIYEARLYELGRDIQITN